MLNYVKICWNPCYDWVVEFKKTEVYASKWAISMLLKLHYKHSLGCNIFLKTIHSAKTTIAFKIDMLFYVIQYLLAKVYTCLGHIIVTSATLLSIYSIIAHVVAC